MLLCFYATLSYIVWPCVPWCHRPASWLAVGLATRVCVSSGDVCGTADDLMSLGSLLLTSCQREPSISPLQGGLDRGTGDTPPFPLYRED